mgnify:CR=1 FL=1
MLNHKDNKNLFIIIIVLLLLLILAVIFCINYRKTYEQSNFVNEKLPPTLPDISISTSTNTEPYFKDLFPLDSTDWPVYRNDEFGFSIKYPKGWEVKTNVYLDQSELLSLTFFDENKKYCDKEFVCDFLKISIKLLSKNVMANGLTFYENRLSIATDEDTEISKFLIDNADVVKISPKKFDYFGSSFTRDTFYVIKNNSYEIISNINNRDLSLGQDEVIFVIIKNLDEF